MSAGPDGSHRVGVGIVVTCGVPRKNWECFEAGLHELIQAASRERGHIAAEVLRSPAGPDGRDYHVVYRFTDEAALRAWHESPTRRAQFARISPLMNGVQRHGLTGLEAWFDLPSGTPPPSRHRMALLTWLGIWPLVSLALWLLAPHLGRLPFLARTALITVLIVAVMTYLVMPWLARLAEPLLRPAPRSSAR